MSQAITTTQVKTASQKLSAMQRSLASWLTRRAKNDQLGIKPANRGQIEANLSADLHALLAELLPGRELPLDAVSLARLALQPMQSSPSAMGGFQLTWPVLIVGGLLLAIVTAIKSYAEVAEDAEEKACIRAGACTDYGFWLKIGGIAMLGYVAHKNGFFDGVKKLFKGRS